MKALFIPCTIDGLPKHTGSRMWRAEWPARNWPGAAVYDGTQQLSQYQLFIFQKAYLSNTAQALIKRLAAWRDERHQPVRLAFDLCDPDFLDDRHRERMLHMFPLFDIATATTEPIRAWLAQYLPAYLVPDGIDLEVIQEKHRYNPGKPSILWAGYKGNTGALNEMAQRMNAMGVTGDILAVDTPLPFAEFQAKIARYDILLNPRPDRPPFIYKSDNKSLLAWALGVAVARDGDELEKVLDPTGRRKQLFLGKQIVNGPGNVARTVEAWLAALKDIGFTDEPSTD